MTLSIYWLHGIRETASGVWARGGYIIVTPTGTIYGWDLGPFDTPGQDPHFRDDPARYADFILDELEASGLDAHMMSHWHWDHGNLTGPDLFDLLDGNVGGVHHSGMKSTRSQDIGPQNGFADSIAAHEIPEHFVAQGDSITLDEDVTVEFLHPLEENVNPPGMTSDQHGAAVVVMRLVYGDFKMLFTGDATRHMLKGNVYDEIADPTATILTMPHHGDNASTYRHNDAVDPVQPELVLVESHPGEGDTLAWLAGKGLDTWHLAARGHTVITAEDDGTFTIQQYALGNGNGGPIGADSYLKRISGGEWEPAAVRSIEGPIWNDAQYRRIRESAWA